MLRLRNASFGYGSEPIVSELNFAVQPGTALAVIGPNGAGKTTLLKGLLGEAHLLTGQVESETTAVGYVPQTTQFDATFPISAGNVVKMGCYAAERKLLWRPTAKTKAKVAAALETVGLADRANIRFGKLSGGQRQRVLLARALVGNPQLVLLDEPFNGLDPDSRTVLLDIISDLKKQGVAVIATTHDLGLARAVCDNTLVVAGSQRNFGATLDVIGNASAGEILCSN
ncbi:metal ABC transporter ATP-binding protein [Corynebacterium hindlerae]|uniref:Metal ABC transporter ATP-binding protein n=1 Tax=Corynebacterium hindlerae TaxID=699041 RepID=A0A7G5FHF1_9CORY|nr:metal ABC transporter ATP-binding protein [Corynebacterium hindlerae]QMV86042.1 metal ABC transporter ATP-binding protein [Corynebacterium hindlerae]